MAGIARYPAANALANFLDSPDSVYGTGSDSSISLDGSTLSSAASAAGITRSGSVYTMSRDLFAYNLTLSDNVTLVPGNATNGGFRIFVKNLLTVGAGCTIGYTTGFSTSGGSILQGGAATTSVTCSLGGNSSGGTYTATAPTAAMGGTAYWYQATQAVKGYVLNAATTTPTFLRGGAGGASTAKGGGVVILAARYISSTATSGSNTAISAPGDSGAGGGVVITISALSALPTYVTTNVTGANSGTAIHIQQV